LPRVTRIGTAVVVPELDNPPPPPDFVARGSSMKISALPKKPVAGTMMLPAVSGSFSAQSRSLPAAPSERRRTALAVVLPSIPAAVTTRASAIIRAVSEKRASPTGRLLMLGSVAVLAAVTTLTATRMWRKARTSPPIVPAAVVAVGTDRLELAPDRRSFNRFGRIEWTSTQPAAVDSFVVSDSVVLALSSSTIVGVDAERGTTRFAWTVPAGERFAIAPVVDDSCVSVLTTRGPDAHLRCLDATTGAPQFEASIANGAECTGPAVRLPGAFALSCPGWTSVIDERTGATTAEAGGVGIVRSNPPGLVRVSDAGKITVSSWIPSTRRFAATGVAVKGRALAATSSIVRNNRVVILANAASEHIALIAPAKGNAVTVTMPQLQLAADTPLVASCDTAVAPRFQLLALAPTNGDTFDPELARTRVLGLLDVDTGRFAWTSKRVVPSANARIDAEPICKHGHYFVTTSAGLWVVDAMTGQTRTTIAAATGDEAALDVLEPSQIGAQQLVGVSSQGAFEARWTDRSAPLPAALRDGRADLEALLGPLP
jgi:hypothetical protein